MTNDKDEYGIGTPVDDDYIDVEKRRADVSTTTERPDDEIARTKAAAGHAQTHPRGDMSHVFDAGSGNGSSSQIDEKIDESAIIEHDGRASTRTFFYPEQAPQRSQQQYKRLIQWQEDKWSGMKNAQRAADRRRTVGTFCSQLDMSEYHNKRVTNVMEGLNMSHMAHYSSEKVILAIISLVANADGRFIRDEDAFRELVSLVDSDLGEIKRVRELVRDKSDRL